VENGIIDIVTVPHEIETPQLGDVQVHDNITVQVNRLQYVQQFRDQEPKDRAARVLFVRVSRQMRDRFENVDKIYSLVPALRRPLEAAPIILRYILCYNFP
jgi:hypothetical protein